MDNKKFDTPEEFAKYLESLTDEEFFRISEPVKDDKFEESPCVEVDLAPTPNGGAYSKAYFYDSEGNPCIRENADFMNIVEYDSEGNRINETYGKRNAQ